MKLAGKTVWITGASSGIGLEMAKQAVASGARVVLSGRNEQKLASAASQCRELLPKLPELAVGDAQKPEHVWVVPFDVADIKAVRDAVRLVVDRGLRIDILVNNAGVGQSSIALETPLEVDRRLMEVNYWGCVYLTKELLPLMLGWGGGHIAVVSSVLGLFAIPSHSSYVSSKHALQGYFSALASECRPLGIGVTLLCPGRIATPFVLATMRSGQAANAADLEKRTRSGMNSAKCARLCWRAIHRRVPQAVIARAEWVPLLIGRCFPNLYLRLLCWAMNRPSLRRKITPL